MSGDMLAFLDTVRRIDGSRPYRGVLVNNGTLPKGTRVVIAGGQEHVTIVPHSSYFILARPER